MNLIHVCESKFSTNPEPLVERTCSLRCFRQGQRNVRHVNGANHLGTTDTGHPTLTNVPPTPSYLRRSYWVFSFSLYGG